MMVACYKRLFLTLCLFLTVLFFSLLHLDQRKPLTGNNLPLEQQQVFSPITPLLLRHHTTSGTLIIPVPDNHLMSTMSVPSDLPNRYWTIDLMNLNNSKANGEETLFKMLGHSLCHRNAVVFQSLVNGAQRQVALDFLKYLSIQPPNPNTFEGLPFQSIQGRKKKVLVVAYWRSGSTFLADLLNQLPGSFYHYEPLHAVSRISVVEDPWLQNASLHLLDSLLRCRYDTLIDYILWMNRRENRFLIDRNTRLAALCRHCRSACMNRTTLSALCQEHPMQLIKVVRLPLNATWTLFKKHPGLQVIHLVRDPRGIYTSRRNLRWLVRYKNRGDPSIFCPGMMQDLQVAEELRRRFPKRFFQVQYESLSLNPFNVTQRLLAFLGFKMNPRVSMYLRSHTRARGMRRGVRDPYGTHRNSQTVPNRWKTTLPFSEVRQVQEACRDVITRLGYEFVNSSQELIDIKLNSRKDLDVSWKRGLPFEYRFQ